MNTEKLKKPNGHGGTADTEREKQDFATHLPSVEPSDGDPFVFLKDDEWKLQ